MSATEAAMPNAAPASSHPAMNSRRVLGLALPIMGENLLQTAVGLVDTLLVSQLGDDAIAGVGVGAEITFFTFAVLSAISIGATVLVSQAIGAGDANRASRLARQAISWGLLIALPLSLLLFTFAPAIIDLFGTERDVRDLAVEYFEVIGITASVLLLSYLCGAVLRGAGDAKTPLKAATLANIVNLAASYLLISGHLGFPELGVAGSAWGATLGRAVAAFYMLRALWRGKTPVSIHGRAGWRPHRGFGAELFRLGIPASIEQMMIQGGTTLLVVIVATLGSAALTAQQIEFTITGMVQMPVVGVAIAATALVGQSIGARNYGDAAKAAAIASRLTIYWSVGIGLVYFALASPIVRVFSDDAEVLELGRRVIYARAPGLAFLGLWMVTAGILRGIGDTRGPMIRGAITMSATVALAFAGVHWLDQGIAWVWLTYLITAPVSIVGNQLAFRRRLEHLRTHPTYQP
jgi:putative MATE family efflux protein